MKDGGGMVRQRQYCNCELRNNVLPVSTTSVLIARYIVFCLRPLLFCTPSFLHLHFFSLGNASFSQDWWFHICYLAKRGAMCKIAKFIGSALQRFLEICIKFLLLSVNLEGTFPNWPPADIYITNLLFFIIGIAISSSLSKSQKYSSSSAQKSICLKSVFPSLPQFFCRQLTHAANLNRPPSCCYFCLRFMSREIFAA